MPNGDGEHQRRLSVSDITGEGLQGEDIIRFPLIIKQLITNANSEYRRAIGYKDARQLVGLIPLEKILKWKLKNNNVPFDDYETNEQLKVKLYLLHQFTLRVQDITSLKGDESIRDRPGIGFSADQYQKRYEVETAARRQTFTPQPTGTAAILYSGLHEDIYRVLQDYANEANIILCIRDTNIASKQYFELYEDCRIEIVTKSSDLSHIKTNDLGLLEYNTKEALSRTLTENYQKVMGELHYTKETIPFKRRELRRDLMSMPALQNIRSMSVAPGSQAAQDAQDAAEQHHSLSHPESESSGLASSTSEPQTMISSSELLTLAEMIMHKTIPHTYSLKYIAKDFLPATQHKIAFEAFLKKNKLITPINFFFDPVIFVENLEKGLYTTPRPKKYKRSIEVAVQGHPSLRYAFDNFHPETKIPPLSPIDYYVYKDEIPTEFGKPSWYDSEIFAITKCKFNPTNRFPIAVFEGNGYKEKHVAACLKIATEPEPHAYLAPIISDIDFLTIGVNIANDNDEGIKFMGEINFTAEEPRSGLNISDFRITGRGTESELMHLSSMCQRLADRIHEIRKTKIRTLLQKLKTKPPYERQVIEAIDKTEKLQLIHHGCDAFMPLGTPPSPLKKILIIMPNTSPLLCRTTEEYLSTMIDIVKRTRQYFFHINPRLIRWTHKEQELFEELWGTGFVSVTKRQPWLKPEPRG